MARPKVTNLHDPGGQFSPAQIFVDESGTSRQARFMVVGALKFRSGQGPLFSKLELLRSQTNWTGEAHFVNVNRTNLHIYRELLTLLASSDARFRAVVVDREQYDPFSSPRPRWKTHAQLTSAVLAKTLTSSEMGSVVVDQISVPDGANYEGYIRTTANNEIGRSAVLTVCRMDSRACWGIQLADLLTGAVTHEYRQTIGEAKAESAKGRLATHTSSLFNVSKLQGARSPRFSVFNKSASSSTGKRRLQVVKTKTA